VRYLLLLQGEESITSADLSIDGNMIVASTMSEIKIFRLRSKTNNALRVQKVEVPQSMARSGARIVQFSPDGRWLVVITPNNPIKIYRVTEDHEGSKALQLLPNAVELRRLPREPAKPKFQHGSLGNYDTLISQVAFSADSRILATGDLSGYLDTWVLEGYEDLRQANDVDLNGVDSSASSDDEDGDEEQRPAIIFGQHWIRNPAAQLVPRLAAAPLILSFRPPSRPSVLSLTNGTPTVHPTRQTPHPHSHDLPIVEDRLFALTSEHQMYEFEILTGRMTSWSRRNPTSSLPEDFRNIRDRAKGLVWDISTNMERIWLYGSSWLWMFNLSKDFPRPGEYSQQSQQKPEEDEIAISVNGKQKRKRKRETRDAQKVVGESGKHDTGAGSIIPNKELGVGIGRKFRRTDGPEPDSNRWINLGLEYSPGSEDDDDCDVSRSALLDLRREVGELGSLSNAVAGHAVSTLGGANTNSDTTMMERTTNNNIPYWSTYKYRPILGIVSLGRESQGEDEDVELDGDDDGLTQGVEVALVERPLWDMDLPPRYHGDQEWDKQ